MQFVTAMHFEVVENTAQAVKLNIIFSTVKETNSVQEKHTHQHTNAHGSVGERSCTWRQKIVTHRLLSLRNKCPFLLPM